MAARAREQRDAEQYRHLRAICVWPCLASDFSPRRTVAVEPTALVYLPVFQLLYHRSRLMGDDSRIAESSGDSE